MRFERKYITTFFAVIFAVFSSVSVYQFLKVRESVSIAAPQSGPALMNVVTAKHKILLGVKLSLQDLEVQKWPAEGLAGTYFKNPNALVGRTTRTNLMLGEPLSESKLLAEGQNISNVIPEDMRAVTISIRSSAMLERMLERGSLVDVLSIREDQEPFVPRVIAQGVRVMSVAGLADKAEKRVSQNMEVSLLVDPTQASRIIAARNNGIIEITVRNDRPQL